MTFAWRMPDPEGAPVEACVVAVDGRAEQKLDRATYCLGDTWIQTLKGLSDDAVRGTICGINVLPSPPGPNSIWTE